MSLFFCNLTLPVLDQSKCEKLEHPITALELGMAVKSLQSGKSPGLNGFPVEFCKNFWKLLAPYLLEMFIDTFASDVLPQTLNQARKAKIYNSAAPIILSPC